MKFIDLFAGLGGFHVALNRLGHECVFACEIDGTLNDLYETNFGIKPSYDLREVKVEDIPKHEILCAGFPCQPFSKAGDQKGFDDPKNGDLFDYVLKIIDYHEPEYFILENVPNLKYHNDGKTWNKILADLKYHNYEIKHNILSPHYFGIPQIRKRLFIVGSQKGLERFSWPERTSADPSIKTILDDWPEDAKPLPEYVIFCINVWQDFIEIFPKDEQLPSFPIWSMEFGATYPYEDTTPHALGYNKLQNYLGSHGTILSGLSEEELWEYLPSYARSKQDKFPDWKIDYIGKNRKLYEENKEWLEDWMPKILKFPPTLQKLEWNCKGEERNIWNYILQYRASGLRVKRPSTSPSLVAMTTTQIPIIAWQKRYLTPRECLRLQSLGQIELPESTTRSFKALGNAVNADIVESIARSLFGQVTFNKWMLFRIFKTRIILIINKMKYYIDKKKFHIIEKVVQR